MAKARSVVRWGQRLAVPTPVNAALVGCIKGIERALVARQPIKEAA